MPINTHNAAAALTRLLAATGTNATVEATPNGLIVAANEAVETLAARDVLVSLQAMGCHITLIPGYGAARWQTTVTFG